MDLKLLEEPAVHPLPPSLKLLSSLDEMEKDKWLVEEEYSTLKKVTMTAISKYLQNLQYNRLRYTRHFRGITQA